MSATELLDQVLRLPREEQVALIRQVAAILDETTDDESFEPSPDMIAEIKRRRDAIKRGETKLLDGGEVMKHLREIVERSKTT